MTHTYVVLEVSRPCYDEIRAKLAEAGHQQAFHRDDDGRELVDMHGIALKEFVITSRIPPRETPSD